MRIGSGSSDENGNDVGINPGIEWEMGMLVWEWEGMGTWNQFPLTSIVNTQRLKTTRSIANSLGNRAIQGGPKSNTLLVF